MVRKEIKELIIELYVSKDNYFFLDISHGNQLIAEVKENGLTVVNKNIYEIIFTKHGSFKVFEK